MSNEVIAALHAALMEHGQVCLPGLGTLSLARQPALVSLLEGKATPPAERVNFNANLVLDDGRLLDQLTPARSVEAAEQLIVDSIQQTRESLDAGRTVFLEGIGKLFKHHDGELRFQGSGQNFSKESFGLPTIDLKPIVRKEKRQQVAVDPMQGGGAAGAQSRTKRLHPLLENPQLRQLLWYVAAGLALLVGLFLLYRLGGAVGGLFTDDPIEPVVEVPRERLNVPPSGGNAAPTRPEGPTVDANRIQPEPAPRLNEAPGAPASPPPETAVPPPVTETPSLGTDNSGVIAIGLYGRQRNVDKQVRRLKEAGYEPYVRPEGRLTRVGARFTYEDPAEVDRLLTAIRDRFAEEAYIMLLNGEERGPE